MQARTEIITHSARTEIITHSTENLKQAGFLMFYPPIACLSVIFGNTSSKGSKINLDDFFRVIALFCFPVAIVITPITLIIGVLWGLKELVQFPFRYAKASREDKYFNETPNKDDRSQLSAHILGALDGLKKHDQASNSSGIKSMVQSIKKIRHDCINETDRLQEMELSLKKIANERLSYIWGAQSFFGKGRSNKATALYNYIQTAPNGFLCGHALLVANKTVPPAHPIVNTCLFGSP